jgi:hypothetical protein
MLIIPAIAKFFDSDKGFSIANVIKNGLSHDDAGTLLPQCGDLRTPNACLTRLNSP